MERTRDFPEATSGETPAQYRARLSDDQRKQVVAIAELFKLKEEDHATN